MTSAAINTAVSPVYRPALRPSRWQRHLLIGTSLLLLASGLAWLALQYRSGSDGLPHPAQAWLMQLHGAGAFVALFAGGLMAGHHIPAGWRHSQRHGQASQRRSGLLLCGTLVLAVLSGYALYYFAPETVRPALGWGHAAVATLMLGLGLQHGLQHRQQHRRRTRA